MDKSNKPITLSKELRTLNVKQTAAQMWYLTRFLPLMVGDYIPRKNMKWNSFLLLRDVICYSCAPCLDRGHVFTTRHN